MNKGEMIYAAVASVAPLQLASLLADLSPEERANPDLAVPGKPNADGERLSALMLAIRNAGRLGPSAVTCREVLLAAGMSAAYVDPATGRNAAHEAATHGLPAGAWGALARHRCDLNLPDYIGDTPLHLGCENGHKEATLALLVMRADVNAKNHAGELPIHSAVRGRNADIIATLVKVARSNLNVRNRIGLTPLGMACATDDADPTERGEAAALLALGADPNMECHGEGFEGIRPLELAFSLNQSGPSPEIVRRLLAAGACPDLATPGRPSLRQTLLERQDTSPAARTVIAAPRVPSPESFLRDRLAREVAGRFRDLSAGVFTPGASQTEALAYSEVSDCYLSELEYRYPTAFAAMENGLKAETPNQSRDRARRATLPEPGMRPDLN